MGNASITPVEQEVTTVADEDLAVVEIVVLNRLGQAVTGQLFALLANATDVPHESSSIR